MGIWRLSVYATETPEILLWYISIAVTMYHPRRNYYTGNILLLEMHIDVSSEYGLSWEHGLKQYAYNLNLKISISKPTMWSEATLLYDNYRNIILLLSLERSASDLTSWWHVGM